MSSFGSGRAALHYQPRRDASGLLEMTIWTAPTLDRFIKQGAPSCGGRPRLDSTPTSSPDAAIFLAAPLLCGVPIRAAPSGFSRFSTLASHSMWPPPQSTSRSSSKSCVQDPTHCLELFTNPAQARWIEEEVRLYAAVRARLEARQDGKQSAGVSSAIRPDPVVPPLIPPLQPFVRKAPTRCTVGGGAVSSDLLNFLHAPPLACATTSAIWGSAELGSLGWSADADVYTLINEVIDWKVLPFGPYSGYPAVDARVANAKPASNSTRYGTRAATKSFLGELWVRKPFANRHADEAGDGRIRSDNKFVRTRNVVQVVGERASRRVRILDKTTRVFRLSPPQADCERGGGGGGGGHGSVPDVGGERHGDGMWVASGAFEHAIEAAGEVERAAVFPDAATGGLAVVVWPSAACLALEDRSLLASVQAALRAQLDAQPTPLRPLAAAPLRLVRAHEPWEYRPRAKLQSFLLHYFLGAESSSNNRGCGGSGGRGGGGGSGGSRGGSGGNDDSGGSGGVRSEEPTTTFPTASEATSKAAFEEASIGGDGSSVEMRGAQQSAAELVPYLRLLRSEMQSQLAAAGVDTNLTAFVADALLACVPEAFGGGCLLCSANGTLREPERRMVPYDPRAPLAMRLARFDAEPWHLFDLREASCATPSARRQVQACEPAPAPSEQALAFALERLHANRRRLVDILPAVWPSLGLLQQLDAKFRLRLSCAHAIGTRSPGLLASGVRVADGDVHLAVLLACRPEWFG